MQVIRDRLNSREKQKLQRILKNPENSKYVGEGATANVYAFDRKRVVRIQEHSPDYPAEVYLPWLRHCLVSRSKHVPKFSYAAYEVGDRGTVLRVVTIMERLHEVRHVYDDSINEEVEYAAYDMENYLCGHEWHIDEVVKPIIQKAFPRQSAYTLGRTLRRKNIRINDLHGGNWMVRKSDGRLVITDPIC